MYAYKVVLVGDFGTGKTSLIRRYVDNSFSEDYISSIGVSISRKQLSNEFANSTMIIWDIEGKTDFKPIFKQYLSGSKGFVIVADLTRQKTIDSIKEHVELCEKTTPNLPIFIALNKSDVKNIDYDIQKIKEISSSIVDVYETSAKNTQNVDKIFQELNNSIVKSNN